MSLTMDGAWKIISDKVEHWVELVISIFPNLLLACVILCVGLIAAKYFKRLFSKLLSRYIAQKNLANLIVSIFHLTIIGVVIFSALSVLKLDGTVTTLLAGAGVLTLALAFAFQDIAANFVSGVFITIQRPFRAGDTIQSKDHYGVVQIVHLRHTIIENFHGQLVTIPNKELFQNAITNFTTLGTRRLDLKVGVSYGDDLEKVERVTLEAVKNISVLSTDKPPKLFFDVFGDSSIECSVLIWLQSGAQSVLWQGRSEAIKLIKKAYDENDITIPFPIRTLDFGIKGGEKLSEVWEKPRP
ncbi:mechanosensitive ion channel [Niabella insulamsoli]|uniref:mechanosensitive ion channel family protein n=1 Tax=Niabella insulamsoli TaxID=3144874 RepID=UPI0031FD792A